MDITLASKIPPVAFFFAEEIEGRKFDTRVREIALDVDIGLI